MAILQRPYHVPITTIASLTERRTSATTLNMFKVVTVGSRREQFSVSSLRPLASCLRSSGGNGVLTATRVALRTQ
ncbi:hypothetical protein DPMN_152807 [Dreissena polymorpha]|uniref:Uncharacterized protein n=1 Tax=Dreissena polymorpha TaxID=45954 RepID=A0A9D4FJK6_DREPO|nr:hypothetical protein DPMN_152188 [Dreissena polymorpha]KAH3799201.1 hypothetical protein DPMN_152807 [Dreissena polymorpha]